MSLNEGSVNLALKMIDDPFSIAAWLFMYQYEAEECDLPFPEYRDKWRDVLRQMLKGKIDNWLDVNSAIKMHTAINKLKSVRHVNTVEPTISKTSSFGECGEYETSDIFTEE